MLDTKSVQSRRVPVGIDRWYTVAIEPHSEMPTDKEVGIIVSYGNFSAWLIYTKEKQEELKSMPLPIAQGHNTTSFVKKAGDGWAYRKRSWTEGLYWPEGSERRSLLALLDHENKKRPQWNTWKTKYPTVFS